MALDGDDMQTLAQKFQIKPGHSLLMLNTPDGYAGMLDNAEQTRSGDATYDFVVAFVKSQSDVDALAPQALAAVKAGGGLWFAYPKKSSGIKTDIHRDAGWDAVQAAGWDGVRQIAIDDTWSALRFRPTHEINYSPTSSRRPK
jgi:hypothetical protein